MIRVVIWNEFIHEIEDKHVAKIYPEGIHGCIKNFLKDDSKFKLSTPNNIERFIESIKSRINDQPDFERGAKIQKILDSCFESSEKEARYT